MRATGDFTGVAALLDRVESWVERAADPAAAPPVVHDAEDYARLPVQVAVYRAALALIAGDTGATTAHASHVLALAEPSDHLRRGSASALLGLAHWRHGDLDAARARYVDAVESFVAAHHLPDMLGCSLALADIQRAQGRLGDAQRTFETALARAGDRPVPRGAADMHVGLADLLVERDELDAAADHLRAAGELGDHAGLPQNAYRRRVAAARLRLAEGDRAAALALLEEAEPVYDTDFSPPVQPVPALTARVRIAAGDLAAATRWAEDSGIDADDDLGYVREFEHVTLARLLLARGEREAALRLVDRLLAAADEGGRGRSAIELLVLRALAREARGERAGAVAAVTDALARAEPEGYVRVFADEVPAITPLLLRVPPGGAAGRHAQRVLRAGSATDATPPRRHDLVDDLSSRELDVLRLLRTDLSGPEIARELVVSLNTVRTHTKNIYAKLGVGTRRQAVRRADELGL